jgi:transcriptional regulator with XRE-family HTH domain
MLQTPLAVLRRVSNCPEQSVLATRLGVSRQRLSAVEAGRNEASEDFLEKVAKLMGFPVQQVVAAYLQGRKAWLLAQVRTVEAKLVPLSAGPAGRRKAS